MVETLCLSKILPRAHQMLGTGAALNWPAKIGAERDLRHCLSLRGTFPLACPLLQGSLHELNNTIVRRLTFSSPAMSGPVQEIAK